MFKRLLVLCLVIFYSAQSLAGAGSRDIDDAETSGMVQSTCREFFNGTSDIDEHDRLELACAGSVENVEFNPAVVVNSATNGEAIVDPNCSVDHIDGTQSNPGLVVADPPPSNVPENYNETKEFARQQFINQGGDPKAFAQAICFLEKNNGKNIEGFNVNPCFLTIQQTNVLPKHKEGVPAFRLNLCTGRVNSYTSATGYKGVCDDGNFCGEGKTPHGFYMLGGDHFNYRSTCDKDGDGETDPEQARKNEACKPWYPGIKMYGLESHNNNAINRGVVMHRPKAVSGAGQIKYYCTDGMRANATTCTGRSGGCTTVSEAMWEDYSYLLNETRGSGTGEIQFTYSKYEANKEEDYCGR